MTITARFPKGTGNSPFAWNPTPDPVSFGTVRAGTWILAQLSYRDTNTKPVATTFGGKGFFLAHLICTPIADDSIVQKGGSLLQPTMYGGSATKRRTSYRVDTGWTFQLPWDCQLQIVSGGVSDPSVIVDVVIKAGFTPTTLVDGPFFEESMLRGGHVHSGVHHQRAFAPPVVGRPALVPATYEDSNGLPDVANIEFPPGASALQLNDSLAISPAPTLVTIRAMGNSWRIGLQPGAIEQLGAMAQGGASSDGVPATWSPQPGAKVYKAVVWSRLGC